MAHTSPKKFFLQVKSEAKKVTWSTRKETIMTSATVIVLAVLIAFFFFIVDKILDSGVTSIFNPNTHIAIIGGVIVVIMACIVLLLGAGG